MTDLPSYDVFLRPVLAVLDAEGGSATLQEIEDSLMVAMALPDAALEVTYEKSGAAILPDRMSWARSYLKLAGLANNPSRRVWVLTDAGRQALTVSEATLKQQVANAFNEREKARRAARKGGETPDVATDDPETAQTLSWQGELLTALKTMDPFGFERLCQRMLREAGFTRVDVTSKTGDGGIDGIGILRVNLVSFQVLFQCKRYAGSVSAPAIRDFRGAMVGRADKGLFITTGTYTAEARREATRDGAPAIDLVDADDLCVLLKDLQIGVKVEMVEQITIDPDFFGLI